MPRLARLLEQIARGRQARTSHGNHGYRVSHRMTAGLPPKSTQIGISSLSDVSIAAAQSRLCVDAAAHVDEGD